MSTNSSGETEPARLRPKGGASDPGRAKDLSSNTDHRQVAPETDKGRPSRAALRENKKKSKWALSTADKANTGPAQDKPNTKTVKPRRAACRRKSEGSECEKQKADELKPS